MIERYSRPEMAALWSDEARYTLWLDVETVALEAMGEAGLAPREAAQAMREKGAFEVERVNELERELKHDVIAFLTNVAEHVGPLSRFTHRGMTSSDLLDTTFAIQLSRAGKLIVSALDQARAAIRARAEEHRYTVCIGRSHGIHAEPTTFGLKLLTWYSELTRAKVRLEAAIREVSVGKIAGPVGTYASIPPSVEAYTLRHFGLEPETVPTQIVARDRHAAFFSALALVATSIEHAAVEIRHLQRTEVREVEEPFGSGQKGSSAMPHKRNPVLSENLTGLARLVRGYAQAALENVVLWHERDISHSSVERVAAPDACISLHFMLTRFTTLVRDMRVYPEQMKRNLELSRGLVFSGTLLVTLVDKGISRENAYAIVQRHALAAWEGGPDLRARVLADPEVTSRLSTAEIEGVFDLKPHIKHVDMIFERALAQ